MSYRKFRSIETWKNIDKKYLAFDTSSRTCFAFHPLPAHSLFMQTLNEKLPTITCRDMVRIDQSLSLTVSCRTRLLSVSCRTRFRYRYRIEFDSYRYRIELVFYRYCINSILTGIVSDSVMMGIESNSIIIGIVADSVTISVVSNSILIGIFRIFRTRLLSVSY